MENTQKCCLCGKEFTGYGNNPYPLVKEQGARCCDECNEIVIPSSGTNVHRSTNITMY